jgi:hypothetical protein
VRQYWLEKENGNYFNEVALPEAGIRLVQAVGRLIRSEHDYGQVTICDNRIVLKPYGKFLLKMLPKFNHQYNAEFIRKSLQMINLSIANRPRIFEQNIISELEDTNVKSMRTAQYEIDIDCYDQSDDEDEELDYFARLD